MVFDKQIVLLLCRYVQALFFSHTRIMILFTKHTNSKTFILKLVWKPMHQTLPLKVSTKYAKRFQCSCGWRTLLMASKFDDRDVKWIWVLPINLKIVPVSGFSSREARKIPSFFEISWFVWLMWGIVIRCWWKRQLPIKVSLYYKIGSWLGMVSWTFPPHPHEYCKEMINKITFAYHWDRDRKCLHLSKWYFSR